MVDAKYAPFWCEENIWHLCREADACGIDAPHAMFISNENRSVAMWGQRASQGDQPIAWDYHVVMLGRDAGDWRIYDLDCDRGPVMAPRRWVEVSFPLTGVVPPEVEPKFRIVPAEDFLRTFRTDRSHMRNEDGTWKAPLPGWPPPHPDGGSNLWEFVDPGGDAPGEVCDLDGLLEWFTRRLAPDA